MSASPRTGVEIPPPGHVNLVGFCPLSELQRFICATGPTTSQGSGEKMHLEHVAQDGKRATFLLALLIVLVVPTIRKLQRGCCGWF